MSLWQNNHQTEKATGADPGFPVQGGAFFQNLKRKRNNWVPLGGQWRHPLHLPMGYPRDKSS